MHVTRFTAMAASLAVGASGLLAGPLVGPVLATAPSCADFTQTVAGNYTCVVPDGMTRMLYRVRGGNGGDGRGSTGGKGATITGVLVVTPGTTVYVTVGGNGGTATDSSTGGSGGGGYSALSLTSHVASPVVVAGGGGGGGNHPAYPYSTAGNGGTSGAYGGGSGGACCGGTLTGANGGLTSGGATGATPGGSAGGAGANGTLRNGAGGGGYGAAGGTTPASLTGGVSAGHGGFGGGGQGASDNGYAIGDYWWAGAGGGGGGWGGGGGGACPSGSNSETYCGNGGGGSSLVPAGATAGIVTGDPVVYLHSQATNDLFANAASLVQGAEGNFGDYGSASGDTSAAPVQETGEPSVNGPTDMTSLWYRFNSSSDQRVEVTVTRGTLSAATVGVYTGGTVNALSEVATFNGAAWTPLDPRLAFDALASTTYWIRVSTSYPTDTEGTFILHVGMLFDASQPGAAIETSSATNGEHATYFVTFDRPVSGLEAGDLSAFGTATGCSPMAPSRLTNVTWALGLSGCGEGTAGIRIAAGATSDLVGNAGPAASVDSGLTVIDRTAPVLAAPKLALRIGAVLPTAAATTDVPVTLTWTQSDARSGLSGGTTLARSVGGGAFADIAAPVAGSPFTGVTPSTATATYRARVADAAGNETTSTGAPTRVVLAQGDAVGLSLSGAWSTAAGSAYSGGSTWTSRAARASLTYRFKGRAIGLVVTQAASRGKVQIWVDGVLVKTLDCYRAATRTRYVAWQKAWATSGSHTLKLVVLGTAGRPRVDVDALEVLK